MSDYFSVKPLPDSNSTSTNHNNNNNNNSNNNNNNSNYPSQHNINVLQNKLSMTQLNPGNMASQDDNRSIHSSQYLMDMIPDNITVRENSTSNVATPSPYSGYNTKDYILPANDQRSPYYVSVPIPNPNVKGQKSVSNTDNADNEEYLVREYPTDILMDRFHKWKKILKGLIAYLREVAYSQEQFARINLQLKSSVKFHFLTDMEDGSNRLVDPFTTSKPVKKQQPKTLAQKRMESSGANTPDFDENSNTDEAMNSYQQRMQQQQFEQFGANGQSNSAISPSGNFEQQESLATSGFMKFGSGSIQDIQVVLKKHHLALSNQQLKISKEISTTLIPKLETLRKDLNFKIKEIKELHNDFKTNMNHHLDVTHKLLHKYIASVKFMNSIITKQKNGTITANDLKDLKPKHDPYLLKLQLDLQLKKQIAEENYLQEAYINLQSSGLKLEKIIYAKIQHALQRYSALIDSEARLTIKNLCHELQQGILSKPPAIEWDHFVSHHPTCLVNLRSNDPLPLPRKLSEVVYPNMKTSFAKCIRAGYFQKKSNFSKEYKRGYFILTPNYIHEFKSSHFYENSNPSTYSQSNQSVSSVASGTSTVGTTTPQYHDHYTSLTPILSIPLNDCALTKATEHHFTLRGKATFIEPPRTPALGAKSSLPSSAMSSHNSSFANLTHTTGITSQPLSASSSKSMLTKKSPFSKLLNPNKSRQAKQEKQQRKLELQEETYTKEQESKNIVTWIFKPCPDDKMDPETSQRHFKKWIQDLKNLCVYNSTNDRMKFIEDKLWKNHVNRTNKMIHMASGSSVPTMNEYNTGSHAVDTSSSTVHLMDMSMRQQHNKPQYISINNSTPMLSQEANFRSKLNTPAIDDNGNLITMAERKNYSFSPNSAVQTPAFSPNYSSVSDLSSMTNNTSQESQPQQPNMVTPTGINVAKTQHQRNISLPVSLSQVNAVNSPASVASDGSGYFGIPVNRGSTEQLNMIPTPPLSRTTSRGGTTSINTSRVPKVILNNDESKRPLIKESSNSTGSLPSLTKQTTNEFYQRGNSSASNLSATQTSRVHPIRKHKKNVSFSSLNSLMFAKKGGQNSAFTGNQLIGGGIREDDDDDEENGNKADTSQIKLNQSLYS